MILLINKNPFDKLIDFISAICCLTPLALIILIPVFWFTGHQTITMFAIAQATCFPIFSYGWLKTMNDKHHWVSWASQKNQEVM